MKHLMMISLLLGSLGMLSGTVYAEVSHGSPSATITPADSNHSSFKTVSNDVNSDPASKSVANDPEKKKQTSICWTCHVAKHPNTTKAKPSSVE